MLNGLCIISRLAGRKVIHKKNEPCCRRLMGRERKSPNYKAMRGVQSNAPHYVFNHSTPGALDWIGLRTTWRLRRLLKVASPGRAKQRQQEAIQAIPAGDFPGQDEHNRQG